MLVGTTIKGLEEISLKELKSSKPKKLFSGRILFESKKTDFQSLLNYYEYISHFKFKDEGDLVEKLCKTKIYPKGPFKTICNREGEHDFSSQEIAYKLGAHLAESFEVDLKNPKTIIYIDIIDNNCILGLNPVNLSKRPYRVKLTSQSLNSCIAFALSIFSEIKKEHVIVDPFCRTAEILIEAVRHSKSEKISGFDNNFVNIRNGRINSKLAQVKINFHKLEAEWLETKFEHESVDRIITFPPIFTLQKKHVLDEYKVLFSQAEIVLKKKGKMCILTTTPEQILMFENKLKLEKRIDFVHGDNPYSLLIFVK